MSNHYKTLGVNSAATAQEIRRAYRILARRYHPDLNPGESNAETFKRIAQAYAVLSDPAQRQQYDAELEKSRESFSSAFDRAHREYRRQQKSQGTPRESETPRPKPPPKREPAQEPEKTRSSSAKNESSAKPKASRSFDFSEITASSRSKLSSLKNRLLKRGGKAKQAGTQVSHISLMEVSVSIFDAIRGVRRTVELTDPNGETKKISAHIPPGVRTGSIVRFRRKEDPTEEVILIIRVAHHPWLSMTSKGLTMEIPLSVSEAIQGGKIQVPSLGDPLLVTVEAGAQSGNEVRLKGQGVRLADGSRGDLFIRFMVKLPENTGATGLKEKCAELAGYYTSNVRQGLPRSILDD